MRLMPVFTSALRLGIIVVLLTIAVTVGSLFLLGIGLLLAWLSPLSLFQGVCTAIGATLAMTALALLLAYTSQRKEEAEREEDDDVEDEASDEDDDENPWLEDEEGRNVSVIVVPAERPQAPKVSRNVPCPCGSGKKSKKCCGSRPGDALGGTKQ